MSKEAVILGEFRLREIKELPNSELVGLNFVSATIKNAALSEMNFFKEQPLPCWVLVPESIADELRARKTYILKLEEKS